MGGYIAVSGATESRLRKMIGLHGSIPADFFKKYIFFEIKLTYQIIHPFKMYDFMFFRAVNSTILDGFYHPKKKSCTC